jgi:hypothetical protein
MLWLKSRTGRLLEGAAWLLDAAISFGLISGAAVAVAFGKFLLGGVLAAFAFAVYLRFKRKRVGTARQEN